MENKSGAVSLGDILGEQSFGLTLLSGGAAAGGRSVLGAHTVEVEAPTRWLARDWVMLTTGVRLRGHAAQRALIEELDGAGVTALGFGVGVVFKKVPPVLLKEAHAREFPLFEVPYETPFREITRFVDSALGRGEAQVFRKLSALQRYLVDALREPAPDETLLKRLASFLDATALVLTAEGEAEAATGPAPVSEIWTELDAHTGGIRDFVAAGWHAVAAPIAAAPDRPGRWLVLTSRRPGFIDKLIRPAVETAAPLLAAVSGVENLVRTQEDAVRSALLTEALVPLEPHEAKTVAARAESFGLDFSQPARITVVRTTDEDDVGRLRRELAAALVQLSAPHLLATRGTAVIALVQSPAEELERTLASLTATHPGALGGIGRAVDEIAAAHHSLRDAELAVDRVSLEPGRALLLFDDFDLATFVVSEVAPDRLAPKVEEIQTVLRANPPLRDALLAYFQHDLDIIATAAVLHLHPNSLRYRLSRVEHLLGRSLKQPGTIASLYIALIADGSS